MKKLSQNVWKTDDGKYLIRVTARRPDGKRDEVERAFLDRKSADRFVADWKAARAYVKAGLRAPLGVAGGLTLSTLMGRHLAELEAAGASEEHLRTVRRLQRFIEKALGPEYPVPLSRDDMVKIATFARAHGDQARKAISTLKTAHRRQGLHVPDSPEVRVLRVGRRSLDDARMMTLLHALPVESPVRAVAETMLRTGCREAEAFRLRARDVDFENMTIRFETRKGPRARRVDTPTVPMTEGLRAALLAYYRKAADPLIADSLIKVDDHEPFFYQIPGRFMQHTSLRRALEKASTKAGIVPAMTGLGWLRNKATSLMVEADVPIEDASRVLGHQSVKTTEAYYDGAKRWKQRVVALGALGRALDAIPAEDPHQIPTSARSPQGNAQDKIPVGANVSTKVESAE